MRGCGVSPDHSHQSRNSGISGCSFLNDEILSDVSSLTQSPMRNLAQLNGNISLSDSEDDTFRNLYRPLIVDTAASPPLAAPEGPEGDVFQNSLQRLLDGIRAGPTLQSSTAS